MVMYPLSQKPTLIIGMSHLVAIKGALNEAELSELNLIQITGEKYQNAFGTESWTTSEFKQYARELLDPDHIFGCPFGNFHNILGLVESPVPFDFLLDDDDAVDESRFVVPEGMMLEHFEKGNRQIAAFYSLWSSVFPKAKLYHFQTPPPIEGGAKLFSRPGAFPGLESYGPTKPQVRMKLYRMQCRVIEGFCADRGVQVLHPPTKALNDRGFLCEDLATDPTHGNTDYGRLVLNQIFTEVLGR